MNGPTKLRVLVVEDDTDAGATMAIFLRHHGHEVEVAKDGPTALRIAAERLPDVALLDFGLPGGLAGVWHQVLDFFGTPLVVEPSRGQLCGDAGLLPIRQFGERIGLTRAFAVALDDPRDPYLTEHTFPEMARSRVYGILAGSQDQNEHDTLRHDPVCKLLADHSPEEDDLASRPTLSRFDDATSIPSLKGLGNAFLGPFIACLEAPLPPRYSRSVPTGGPTWRSGARNRRRCGRPWPSWATTPGPPG
jgi:hypothetical protein